MKVAILSGGFDPVHGGHIRMFMEANQKFDKVIVAVNSDAWLVRKKGINFMTINERRQVVVTNGFVDATISFNDDDDTSCDALRVAKELYPDAQLVFCNGGDRTKDEIPEAALCKELGIWIRDGIGGSDKANSSSDILSRYLEASSPAVTRRWGSYKILHETDDCKVKELTLLPGKSISLQSHEKRTECWAVVDGVGSCDIGPSVDDLSKKRLDGGSAILIRAGILHKLANIGDVPLVVIETQTGSYFGEDDIERFEEIKEP